MLAKSSIALIRTRRFGEGVAWDGRETTTPVSGHGPSEPDQGTREPRWWYLEATARGNARGNRTCVESCTRMSVDQPRRFGARLVSSFWVTFPSSPVSNGTAAGRRVMGQKKGHGKRERQERDKRQR
jgi:hypothetical protein